ncbi:MAG: DUF1800 domain-containing protein [Planctomycetota bacterium]
MQSDASTRLGVLLGAVFLATAHSSCSDSGGSPSDPVLLLTDAEAARFLARASFGPSPAGVQELREAGYQAWLDGQVELPPSLMKPALLDLGCSALEPGHPECEFIDPHIAERDRLWWEHAVYGEDQLRQRVAFALSEIFVISVFNAELAEYPVLIAEYYDMLAQRAFGSYRELIEEVTLHPAMGVYLSMLGNRKADPVLGTRPDENYAREVMQLFSIGLVQLDAAGRPVLDELGQTIPTYTQDDIEELARVFTGWTWSSDEPKSASLEAYQGLEPRFGRMEAWPAFHDADEKALLGSVVLPAGLAAEVDLALALDALASHPNVGPFLARQLIQRLVTSNPAPEYVERVAATFNDDGKGQRGNLEAVVRAILLDPAALGEPPADGTFGKVREPVLRLSALWRAFETEPPTPDAKLFDDFLSAEYGGQQALYSPSVFNFFSPFYSNAELAAQGLVAPELQVSTHATLVEMANFTDWMVRESNTATVAETLMYEEWSFPVLDLSPVASVAGDVGALVDELSRRFLASAMSSEMRAVLEAALLEVPLDDGELPPGLERAMLATSLVLVSPEFIVQQ